MSIMGFSPPPSQLVTNVRIMSKRSLFPLKSIFRFFRFNWKFSQPRSYYIWDFNFFGQYLFEFCFCFVLFCFVWHATIMLLLLFCKWSVIERLVKKKLLKQWTENSKQNKNEIFRNYYCFCLVSNIY